MGKRLAIISFVITGALWSMAQEVTLKGGFLGDSISIGEEIHFWLTADYPADLQLILPDSNYRFAPFELVAKEISETQSRNGLAHDSAVYKLQSFEIDPVQYLKLSAIALSKGDSLLYESPMDSLFFRALVPIVTDTTRLKTNLSFLNVPYQFNYPLVYIILFVLIFISLLVLLLFGKRIRKHFRVRRLKKDYEGFSSGITNYIRELKESPEAQTAEKALTFWKTYLERLEAVPYTKYTSKEILSNKKNAELKDTLKEIDRAVFGKIPTPEIFKNFQDIEDFTQHRYSMTLDKLKNGG